MWLPPFKFTKGLIAQEQIDGISNSDGTTYIGPYFKTSTGEIYSGEYPNPNSEILIENFSKKANKYKRGIENLNYQSSQETIESEINHPKPRDFGKGFFVRYFVRDSRTEMIAEVKEKAYDSLLKLVHISGVKVRWIIAKPVKDIFNQGFLFKGAATRNRENILEASRKLPGIENFVVDYAQYANIQSDVEGVPFDDLSEYDKIRIINTVPPINVQPSTVPIKPLFEDPSKPVTKPVRTNLYTNGGRYKIAGTNEEYIGFYHVHPEKGAMVGAVHVSESHSRLIPILGEISTTSTTSTSGTSPVPTPANLSIEDNSTQTLTDGGGGGYSGGGGGASSGGGGYGSSY